MQKLFRKFERLIIMSLLAMMSIVVFLGTVELAIILVRQMLESPTIILLDINEMLTVFGFFLMILIGLELMETMKVYLVEDSVHVEIIFLVAIIAIYWRCDNAPSRRASFFELEFGKGYFLFLTHDIDYVFKGKKNCY